MPYSPDFKSLKVAKKNIYSILVIEDLPADRVIIEEAFLHCGHHCELTFVGSVEEALLSLRSASFHLVLLDIKLDWQDGLEVLKAMRADTSLAPIPVIILSGMPSQVSRAYQAGANAFIAKSMELEAFSLNIKAVMDFWIHIAELPESVPVQSAVI